MPPLSERFIFSENPQGQHRLAYNDWGPEDGQPLLCIHGLTGNGYDFDFLAEDLVRHNRRLIALDLPGRGRSDFLPDPMDYNYGQYLRDIKTLLAHLKLNTPGCIDWLGVSLGGLLGFRMAGLPDSPVRRLIINDVGPEVPQAALDFIFQVISKHYAFETLEDFENRLKQTRGLTWGPVTEEQWKHMAKHNARALDDGRITYAYDPHIAEIFKNQPIGEADLWPYWEKIACPVLLIQGIESLLLTPAIIEKMEKRYTGSELDVAVFKNCGHVPSLMAPHQIEVIKEWLAKAP